MECKKLLLTMRPSRDVFAHNHDVIQPLRLYVYGGKTRVTYLRDNKTNQCVPSPTRRDVPARTYAIALEEHAHPVSGVIVVS